MMYNKSPYVYTVCCFIVRSYLIENIRKIRLFKPPQVPISSDNRPSTALAEGVKNCQKCSKCQVSEELAIKISFK